MKKLKNKTGFSLILLSSLLLLFPDQLPAFDFEFEFLEDWSRIEKKGNEAASLIYGNLALLCLIIANVYTLAKFLIGKNSLATQETKATLGTFLKVHIVFNILLFILTLIHAHYAEATSVFLIASLIAMACLFIGGALLRFQPNLTGARQYLVHLHTQQYLFSGTIFLLIIGHILAWD